VPVAAEVGGSIVTIGVVLGSAGGFGDVIGLSDVVERDVSAVELIEPVLLLLVLTEVD